MITVQTDIHVAASSGTPARIVKKNSRKKRFFVDKIMRFE